MYRRNFIFVFLISIFLNSPFLQAGGKTGPTHDLDHASEGLVHDTGHGGHGDGHGSAYPLPLTSYDDAGLGVWESLKARVAHEPFNLVVTVIFFLAVVHTFLSGKFRELAHKHEHLHEEKIRKEGRTAQDKLERLIVQKKKARVRGIVESLSSINIIRALPPEEIEKLIAKVDRVTFSVDTIVFKEGDIGDSFYLLESGEVEVVVGDSTVAKLGHGSSFGEMALLSGEPRNATIRATSPVHAFKITKESFDRLAQSSPKLMEELKLLSESRDPASHKLTSGEDENSWRITAMSQVEGASVDVTDEDREEAGHEEAVDDVSIRATIYEFLGEVEAIFGVWCVPLFLGMIFYFGLWTGEGLGHGWHVATHYVGHDLNFTEPVFVVIIMAVASTRPVLKFAEDVLRIFAKIGKETPGAWWMSILTVAPIMGSFITEPAAITIGAMVLSRQFYSLNPSQTLKYASIGALFVNVSVGGTLTHFAAPPVLMVAEPWGWGMSYMFFNFGWKAAIAIVVINIVYWAIFKKEFAELLEKGSKGGSFNSTPANWLERQDPIPVYVTVIHLLCLAWTVVTLHYPPLFIGGFLFFIAFTTITLHHQNMMQLKSPLLVGFFLAGLKVHGELQGWWISPVLVSLMENLGELPLLLGAEALTAFNDNAAITLLATLVPEFNASDPSIIADPAKLEFAKAAQHAVVYGAVAGGGLTVIANAPNPAGQSILNKHFRNGVAPGGLFLGAAIPTAIVTLFFILL